jgi:hypothetical protein
LKHITSIFQKEESPTHTCVQEAPVKTQVALRPGDIPYALRLAAHPGEGYEDLAEVFRSSTSSGHRAVARLQQAGLLLPGERRISREALREFLIHGVRYAFPAIRGPETRGIPTAWSAPPLEGILPPGPVVVWPAEPGQARGEAVVPLSENVTHAVRRDPWLYETLALVDALRLGQARDRRLAAERLEVLLGQVSS